MNAFDLDMAFEPAEVAAGLERLFRKLGIVWSCACRSPGHYEFRLTRRDGEPTQVVIIVVQPLPAERVTAAGFSARSLLEARAATGVDLDALRKQVLLAFMRVMG